MSKRCSYNGYILPALPEWIRAKYPYAFIGKNALFNPSYYYLVAVDKVGYIGMYGGEDMFGPGYTLGAYGLGDSEKLLTRCDWFVAANSEAIEDIEDTFPGITDTEWLLDKENYKNVSCGGTSQNIIWSNHDILNEDGTLRIAASDPIPVEEETPTVIPYSYNGYILPELPDYDQRKYPYAYIIQLNYNVPLYQLVLMHSDARRNEYVDDGSDTYTVSHYLLYDARAIDDTWDGPMYCNGGSIHVFKSPLVFTDGFYNIWSNFDIYDGSSLVCAASIPIPVKEEPPVEDDPPEEDNKRPCFLRSWLTGYVIGLSGNPLPLMKVEE